MTTIVTEHVYPPIPIRFFDWAAWVQDSDPEHRVKGTGKTEFYAVLDLYNEWDNDMWPEAFVAHRQMFEQDYDYRTL